MFLFGTPIGNRTLVSAVRGRRLEPLDHEGKSILLCDNSINHALTQAKINMFCQKIYSKVLFGIYFSKNLSIFDKKIPNSILIFI